MHAEEPLRQLKTQCNIVRKAPDNIAQEKSYAMLSQMLPDNNSTGKNPRAMLPEQHMVALFHLNIYYDTMSITSKEII